MEFSGMTPEDVMVIEDLCLAFSAVFAILIVTMFRRMTREVKQARPVQPQTGRFHLRPSHA